jgi:long-subunit fatty acid transport protein
MGEPDCGAAVFPMERRTPLCQANPMPSSHSPRAARASVWALAASLCLGSAAHAAGFYFPDLGPKQLGRGATGVAGPGDLSALTYNPAGLALLPEQGRLFLQLGASASHQPVSYTRSGGCGLSARPCAAVEDTAGWYPNTLSGAAVDLGLAHPALSGWVFAVGLHGPSALGSHTYPDPRLAASASDVSATAPQRYSLISSENLILYPAFALATRLTPWLDAGLSLDLRYFHIKQTQSIFGIGELGGDLPAFDAIATFDAVQKVAPVLGGGLIAHPPQLPGFSIGLSGRLRTPVSADGTLDIEVPALASALALTVQGNQAHLAFDLPSEARLGVQYETSLGLVAADVTWEGWGVLRGITVTPQNVKLVSGTGANQTVTTVDPIVLKKDFHGAFSGRVGGEARLPGAWNSALRLVLRAGVLAETSAIPDETLQVDFVDGPRVAVTCGASLHAGPVELTVGVAHYLTSTRTITSSVVSRTNPYPGAPPYLIGNGVYTTSLDSLAFQATWATAALEGK